MVKKRTEPCFEAGKKICIRQIRPAAFTGEAGDKAHPTAQLLGASAPAQALQPKAAYTAAQGGDTLFRLWRHQPLTEDNRPEAPHFPPDHPFAPIIPENFPRRLRLSGDALLQSRRIKRGGEVDFPFTPPAGAQLQSQEPRGRFEAGARREAGADAAGKEVVTALSLPFLADAIGKGRGKEAGKEGRRRSGAGTFLATAEQLTKLPGGAGNRRTGGSIGTLTAPGTEFETIAQIAATAMRQRGASTQGIALGKEGGEGGAERPFPNVLRGEEEAGETGMGRECGHTLPEGGDAPAGIEGAELPEQGAGGGEMSCRRRVEPAEGRGIADPPARQLQRQGSEIGAADLRRRVGKK